MKTLKNTFVYQKRLFNTDYRYYFRITGNFVINKKIKYTKFVCINILVPTIYVYMIYQSAMGTKFKIQIELPVSNISG